VEGVASDGESEDNTVVYEMDAQPEEFEMESLLMAPVWLYQQKSIETTQHERQVELCKEIIQYRLEWVARNPNQSKRENFVRHLNVAPLVPGSLEVIVRRATQFCNRLWKHSADSANPGKMVEHVAPEDYPLMKFDKESLRVNVQLLKAWVTDDQIIYSQCVVGEEGTVFNKMQIQAEGWTS